MMESRAMKNAHFKNKTQEKKLIQQFQALDLDLKARYGKLMSQKSDTEYFMSKINSVNNITVDCSTELVFDNNKVFHKSYHASMTLSEFDCRLQEKDKLRSSKQELKYR